MKSRGAKIVRRTVVFVVEKWDIMQMLVGTKGLYIASVTEGSFGGHVSSGVQVGRSGQAK